MHYEKFLEDIRAFEYEKMHFFILVENEKVLILKSPSDKTTDNKSNKANIIKFLGYDWSKRKGDEGIKYQTSLQDTENAELKESEDDSDEDKKQKEALRNINSVKFISTPLYNPQNPSDPTKLCYAIKSFIESSAKIDSIINALQSDDKDFYKLFISEVKAMLDFSKVDFNKAISLNPINSQGEGKTQNPFENCKYELVKMSELMQDNEIALDIQSAKRPKGGVGNYTEGALSLGGEHIDNKSGYVKMQTPKYVPMEFYEDFKKADKGIVRKNDILLCKDGALTGKVALVRDEFKNQSVMINEHIFLLRCQNSIAQKFLFFILHSQSGQNILKSKVTGSAQGGLNLANLKDMKIPKPDIEIQKQIVAECEKVEEQYNTIRMSIEKYQELIKAILVKCGIIANTDESIGGGGGETSRLITSLLDSIQELESKLDFNNNNDLNLKALLDSIPIPPAQGWNTIKLNNKKYLTLNPSKREIANIDENTIISFVEMASVADKGYIQNKVDKPLKELKKGSYTYFAENDILIAKITPCMENGKCAIAKNLTNGLGMGSSEFHIFRTHKGLNNKFLFACLNQDSIRQEAAKNMTGSSGHRRVPISFYESLQIPLPPFEAQEKIVSAIERIESKIHLLDSRLPQLDSKKSEVLQHFLEA